MWNFFIYYVLFLYFFGIIRLPFSSLTTRPSERLILSLGFSRPSVDVVVHSCYVLPVVRTRLNSYAFGEKVVKTFSATPETIKRDWYVVDASGKTLGRLSTEIARRLRGKHKPEYTPHMDTGDYIVVVNAEKIHATGNKMKDKIYYHHTGFPGGLKSISLEKLLQEAPERVIESAVKGMLPRGPLGREMYRKLKVYAGPEHAHAAQQPQPLDI